MFTVGDKVGARTLSAITGAQVQVPTPDRIVHLQFRRFAECPICNLHVRELARRNAEIESAGITEVVVFHSSADRLREYQADLPRNVQRELTAKNRPEFRSGRALGAQSYLSINNIRELPRMFGLT